MNNENEKNEIEKDTHQIQDLIENPKKFKLTHRLKLLLLKAGFIMCGLSRDNGKHYLTYKKGDIRIILIGGLGEWLA